MAKNKNYTKAGVVLAVLLISIVLTSGCIGGNGDSDENTNPFKEKANAEICIEDNKPVIRLFSTTTCSHCKWIKGTFDSLVKEYVEQGKIVAYHWKLDTGENSLTPEVETEVPESEDEIFSTFSPQGYVPAFVFGCKYSRIGNAFETEGDLAKEETEFRFYIEKLINETSSP